MSVVYGPAVASHVRAGRFLQRERPAANIPARIRARRVALGARYFGPRARIATVPPVDDEGDSVAVRLTDWLVGRLSF